MALRQHASEHGVTVAFIPPTYLALPEWYRQGDVFVLSSEQEGLPNAICEALASGLPIVTTPVGGIPDYLENNQHCLYTTVGDVCDLTAKLIKLYEDADLRLCMSQENRMLAKRSFSLEERCRLILSSL